MKVLVTGATGRLGRSLIPQLLAAGHQVRIVVRPGATTQGTASRRIPPETDVLPADLSSGAGVTRACLGVDVVIHLAMEMHADDDQKLAFAQESTRHLLRAVRGSRTRFILASSFSVYDWRRIGAAVTENSPLLETQHAHGYDGYTRAKVSQERLARRLCKTWNIDLTVLRPATIWSTREEAPDCLGPHFGRLQLVVAPHRTLRLTHVENCASAFVAALDARAIGGTFNVADGFATTAWAFRRASLRVPLSARLAQRLSRGACRLFALLAGGRTLPGLLHADRLHARFHPARAGHAAMTAVLGWHPPCGFEVCCQAPVTPPVEAMS